MLSHSIHSHLESSSYRNTTQNFPVTWEVPLCYTNHFDSLLFSVNILNNNIRHFFSTWVSRKMSSELKERDFKWTLIPLVPVFSPIKGDINLKVNTKCILSFNNHPGTLKHINFIKHFFILVPFELLLKFIYNFRYNRIQNVCIDKKFYIDSHGFYKCHKRINIHKFKRQSWRQNNSACTMYILSTSNYE